MSETNTENGKVEKVEVKGESEDVKETPEKTFTQEELDKIVANRVGREAEKVAALGDTVTKLEAKLLSTTERAAELELEVNSYSSKVESLELDKIKNAVAFESGVEPAMLDSLRWDNEEELRAAVKQWKSSISSPNSSVFRGKDYYDNDSPTRFARNVAKKYE